MKQMDTVFRNTSKADSPQSVLTFLLIVSSYADDVTMKLLV